MTPPTRRDRKRQQTLDHIARTAYALFQAYGFDAVTMEQIAAEADIAKGTLYKYFPVKEAVLSHWIHAELAQDLAPLLASAATAGSFAARVATVLQASVAWCEAHRGYLAPYLRYRLTGVGQPQPGNHDEPSADLAQAFAALIARGQADGELRHDLSTAQLALYLHFLYLSALLRWLDDARLSLTDEFGDIVTFFLQGAAARDPRRAGAA